MSEHHAPPSARRLALIPRAAPLGNNASVSEEPGAEDDDSGVDMPERALRRGLRIASLPVGHVSRRAIGIGKKIGGRPGEVVNAQIQARTAEQLFRVLGELKGGAMKVGQAMSVFEAAFPEDLAGPYRAMLTKLQEAAPPMPRRLVESQMADELGPDWRDRFREWDDRPAAAASIGQVHRAVARDGREVAVKIQYPGAGKALLSDLKQLSRLARLFGTIAPGLDVKPLIQELTTRVSEELDYLRESDSQRAFAAGFEADPDFEIPHVLAAAPRVIISEWVSGRPLADVIANGTQDERDHAGLLYLRFLLSGPARAGLMHADPHPGNFRITDEGKLAVVDFGAVAHLPDGFPEAMGHLIRVALEGNSPEEVTAGLRAEGFIRPGIDLDPQELMSYLTPYIEPLRDPEFRFSRAWMQQQFNRIRDPRGGTISTGLKLNLPPSYLLIHRVWMGSTGVLCQLQCKIQARGVAERWVPGFAG